MPLGLCPHPAVSQTATSGSTVPSRGAATTASTRSAGSSSTSAGRPSTHPAGGDPVGGAAPCLVLHATGLPPWLATRAPHHSAPMRSLVLGFASRKHHAQHLLGAWDDRGLGGCCMSPCPPRPPCPPPPPAGVPWTSGALYADAAAQQAEAAEAARLAALVADVSRPKGECSQPAA